MIRVNAERAERLAAREQARAEEATRAAALGDLWGTPPWREGGGRDGG